MFNNIMSYDFQKAIFKNLICKVSRDNPCAFRPLLGSIVLSLWNEMRVNSSSAIIPLISYTQMSNSSVPIINPYCYVFHIGAELEYPYLTWGRAFGPPSKSNFNYHTLASGYYE